MNLNQKLISISYSNNCPICNREFKYIEYPNANEYYYYCNHPDVLTDNFNFLPHHYSIDLSSLPRGNSIATKPIQLICIKEFLTVYQPSSKSNFTINNYISKNYSTISIAKQSIPDRNFNIWEVPTHSFNLNHNIIIDYQNLNNTINYLNKLIIFS